MPSILILSLSVLLQVIALVLALRLIPLTRGRTAWLLITGSLLIIIARRVVRIWSVLAGLEHVGPSDPLEASLNVVTSGMLVAGVWLLKPLFLKMIHDREVLRQQIEESETVMALTPAVIWVAHDPQCHRVTGNRAANDLFLVHSGDNVSMTPAAGQASPRLRFFQYGSELAPEALPMQVAAANGKAIHNAEIEVVRPDGIRQVIFGNASPLRGSGGEVRGVVAAFVDVTDHRRAQDALRKAHDELEVRVLERTAELQAAVEKLRASEEKFAKAFASAPVSMVISSIDDGTYLDVNDTFVLKSGFSREEVIGRTVASVGAMSPQDRGRIIEILRGGGTVVGMELVFRAKDGGAHTYLYNGELIRIEGRDCLLSISVDITARKQAEESLRRSEEMMALIFRHSSDGINILEFDPKTLRRRLVLCNDRYVAMTGRTREQLMAADDIGGFVRDYGDQENANGNLPGELVLGVPFSGVGSWQRPDGNENYFEWTGCSIRLDGKILVVGVDRDITDRKKTEEALRRNQEMFDLIFRYSNDGISIVEVDPQTGRRRLVLCNDRFVEMSGHTREQLMGSQDINPLFQGYEGSPVAEGVIPEVVLGVSFSGQASWQRPDGKENYFEWTACSLSVDGNILVVGVDRDVTERRKTEEALRRNQEMLDLIFRHSSDGICVVKFDPQTRGRKLMLCNDRYLEMSGYTREQLMAEVDLNRLVEIHEDSGKASKRATGEPVLGIPIKGLGSWLRPDGKENYTEWTACAIRVGEDILVVGVDRDATERKNAEERLISTNAILRANAEKLRSLTLELSHAEQRERQRMAAVLHDDVQQFLVAAKLNISAMTQAPEDTANNDFARKAMAALDEAIAQSRSLTVELSPVPRETGLGIALQRLGRQMHDLHGLTVKVDAGDWRVDEDLRVVLFNAVRELLLNVVKHSGAKSAQVDMQMLPDNQVRIVVTDEGAGFVPADAESNSRMHGGFGLFAIRERLESLGGWVDISSSPGRGTSITLTASAHSSDQVAGQDSSMSQIESPHASGSGSRGGGTRVRVLLADDHVMMRQGIAQLLSQAPDIEIVGEASDGEEAVRLAQEIRPDVVVMDVNMQGMNGIEATRAIRAHVPDVAVIALSMNEESQFAQEMKKAGAAAYITKSEAAGALVAAIYACCRR